MGTTTKGARPGIIKTFRWSKHTSPLKMRAVSKLLFFSSSVLKRETRLSLGTREREKKTVARTMVTICYRRQNICWTATGWVRARGDGANHQKGRVPLICSQANTSECLSSSSSSSEKRERERRLFVLWWPTSLRAHTRQRPWLFGCRTRAPRARPRPHFLLWLLLLHDDNAHPIKQVGDLFFSWPRFLLAQRSFVLPPWRQPQSVNWQPALFIFFFFFTLFCLGYTHNPYNGVIYNDTILATGVFSSKELWRLSKSTSSIFL